MSIVDGPPNMPYPKLPFWDVVSLSYSTFFSHFIDALRASWLWMIAVALITGFASWHQWSLIAAAASNVKPNSPPQMATEVTVLFGLNNVLVLFAGVSIAVAWHRLMILNEQPGFSGSNIATKNLWRYVVAAIALFVILYLPAAVIMAPTFYFLQPAANPAQPSPGLGLLFLLGFVGYAVCAAVTLRLSLLLPAQAIGNTDLTLKQTWNRTRGNIWRLFWGIVFTTMPLMVVAQIIFFVLIGPPHPNLAGDKDFVPQIAAASTVFTVYYLLIVPIGIGFLSHAYRHFFQAPIDLWE